MLRGERRRPSIDAVRSGRKRDLSWAHTPRRSVVSFARLLRPGASPPRTLANHPRWGRTPDDRLDEAWGRARPTTPASVTAAWRDPVRREVIWELNRPRRESEM